MLYLNASVIFQIKKGVVVMITKKVIVTNNKKACKKYENCAEVIYMENAHPYDIFSKTMELLKSGARLSNHEIKDQKRYYRTVALFYGDENAPIEQNLKKITEVMEMTRNSQIKAPAFNNMAMLADLADCGMSVNPVE